MAAVLLAKGVSPGAVLVGMLLGPATNVATVGVLGRAYGGRATALGLLVVLAASCLIGFGLNAVGIPIALPPDLEQVHEHGVIAWGAIAVLAGGLGVQLWRGGIGPWLEILDAGHVHGHDHGHGHDHDHDHGHDHDHDHVGGGGGVVAVGGSGGKRHSTESGP
jgi:hypothetical protein